MSGKKAAGKRLVTEEAADDGRVRAKHLRVPVFPEEERAIADNAARAGRKVARFLREVGQGYEVSGIVDYLQVQELSRINGDLGRLGGLLKWWLTDDPRTAQFGESTIRHLLARIEATQDEMVLVMRSIVRPRAK